MNFFRRSLPYALVALVLVVALLAATHYWSVNSTAAAIETAFHSAKLSESSNWPTYQGLTWTFAYPPPPGYTQDVQLHQLYPYLLEFDPTSPGARDDLGRIVINATPLDSRPEKDAMLSLAMKSHVGTLDSLLAYEVASTQRSPGHTVILSKTIAVGLSTAAVFVQRFWTALGSPPTYQFRTTFNRGDELIDINMLSSAVDPKDESISDYVTIVTSFSFR